MRRALSKPVFSSLFQTPQTSRKLRFSQIHPLINDVPSAQELVHRIVREAEEIIAARLSGMMQPRAQAAE